MKELIIESVGLALSGSNIKCTSDLPSNLSPVEVDRSQMTQVLQNLLINARQAMPSGGLIIIHAENMTVDPKIQPSGLTLQPGHYVKLSIKDQGVGMEPIILEKVFDPYFTTKAQGSGLGLTTTFSIMRNHGGDITVESQSNVGSTFSLYLPAVVQGVLTRKSGETGDVLIGQGRIMIMDDERYIRELLRDMCEELGYFVELVCDGDGGH